MLANMKIPLDLILMFCICLLMDKNGLSLSLIKENYLDVNIMVNSLNCPYIIQLTMLGILWLVSLVVRKLHQI